MWPKTLTSFFLGLLLSISLMMNLASLLPLAIDTVLIIGFIANFFVWSGVMVYFYAFDTIKKPLIQSGLILLVSIVGNILLLPSGAS